MSTQDRDIVIMEEGRAETIVGEQAHETSRGNEQTIVNAIIEERLKSLDDLSDEKKDDQEQTNRPVIPRVPTRLRENENLKECFEPKAVSIGPYHHGKENLKVTEKMKLKLAAMFVKENFKVDKKDPYLTIRKEIEDLKKCYELDATKDYDDDDLAWMFFIDGCVVLHFLDKGTIDGADRDTLVMDLLLLENQLPFQVLKLLMRSSKYEERLMGSIEQFIRSATRIVVEGNQKQAPEDPAHLLDLMRKTYRTEFVRDDRIYKFLRRILLLLFLFAFFLFYLYFFLFLLFLFRLIVYFFIVLYVLSFLWMETTQSVDVKTIQELTEFGIELKPAKSGCFTDIAFKHGTLKIPRIYVDNSIASRLLNLVAYEITSKASEDFKVSNYIFSLTSLITHEEDVTQLRVNRILYNNFGSNEEVVKLFQKIGTIDFPEESKSCHPKILKEMQEHCKKKYKVWKGQFKNRYFNSPWSVSAAVVAVAILILTLLQTIYTVIGYHTEHGFYGYGHQTNETSPINR